MASIAEDTGYHSSSDSDFDPTAQAAPEEEDVFSSEDEAGQHSAVKRSKKRKAAYTTAAEAELDSGDEATIKKGQRKKKKKGATGDQDDEDEAAEGGLIKTRAQRAREKEERKPLAKLDGATVDVDNLWASMNSATPSPLPGKLENAATIPSEPGSGAVGETRSLSENTGKANVVGPSSLQPASKIETNGQNVPAASEDMIAIKRTYKFAGETITESKLVPKDSAEARLYLQEQNQNTTLSPEIKTPLRRPKKRISIFEPNPMGEVKGLPVNSNKGPKLNTIEKSKLDWAGFVDKEGIKDELDEAGRSKQGYLGKVDFLSRMDAKREGDFQKFKK